jgi:enoyl-CoA hydratase
MNKMASARGYRNIEYVFQPPIAYITLDRPHDSNRVDLPMAMELRQLVQQLREEEGAYVGVLTGRGTTFSSGRETLSLEESARQGYTPTEWLELHRAASAIASIEIPLIAAIKGDALDQGLELALACDMRIAARGARLGFDDLSRGTMPWDGGTQRLPRLVGRTLAAEMLLTCRRLDAEEAYRAGLVNMVVEPEELMESAKKVALTVASGAPIAARYAKETLLKGMDMTLEQGLRLEADLNLILQSTSDRAEGLRSFLEKRAPEFRGE